MSLLDVVRADVKVADKVTKPLQTTVKYERENGIDGSGTRTFDLPLFLPAIVDYTSRMVRTREGILTACRSSVMFLDAQTLNQATKGHGIRTADRITLPNGETGPILDIMGFNDPGTLEPVATQVMLG